MKIRHWRGQPPNFYLIAAKDSAPVFNWCDDNDIEYHVESTFDNKYGFSINRSGYDNKGLVWFNLTWPVDYSR